LADPLNKDCSPNLRIQLHALHPPALCPVGQRTIHCRILAPAQPDNPAASLRDFGSGAYSLAVIISSAGTVVAISMALGLATAPLFRAFLAFNKPPATAPAIRE